jgi:hypothetical protein
LKKFFSGAFKKAAFWLSRRLESGLLKQAGAFKKARALSKLVT